VNPGEKIILKCPITKTMNISIAVIVVGNRIKMYEISNNKYLKKNFLEKQVFQGQFIRLIT